MIAPVTVPRAVLVKTISLDVFCLTSSLRASATPAGFVYTLRASFGTDRLVVHLVHWPTAGQANDPILAADGFAIQRSRSLPVTFLRIRRTPNATRTATTGMAIPMARAGLTGSPPASSPSAACPTSPTM
jgi:hypothetical protein